MLRAVSTDSTAETATATTKAATDSRAETTTEAAAEATTRSATRSATKKAARSATKKATGITGYYIFYTITSENRQQLDNFLLPVTFPIISF